MILPKTYQSKEIEEKIYQLWERSGYFNPDNLPLARRRPPFSIAMPPPNVTGSLHVGHATALTLEDLIIRFRRMQGYQTLYLPGTDHAGIATQILVEKKLWQEQKKTKYDLGKEKFLEEVWKFKNESENNILAQIKKIGASCDWSRYHFTLDPDLNEAVFEAFLKLYEAGLVYRGEKVVHWCPRCESVVSDLEVEFKEIVGKLWYIKYKLKASNSKFKAIVVATTRPETMLGDTAVAVNPKDSRYKKLIGQAVIVPLVNREIPVIADKAVDMNFGTGAVKVTPAHDPLDFEIGSRHKLPTIQVIGKNGKMNKNAKKFSGLKTILARERIVEELKNQNLIEKIESYKHALGFHDRCGEILEFLMQKQWFVKTKPLAKKAIRVVKEKKIKIIPERFEKIYFNWLKNIKDWCISRQIWWGHRIPVYYCDSCLNAKEKLDLTLKKKSNVQHKISKGIIVSKEKPKKCPKCGNKKLIPEQDTLDTWFSSALWTFSTLGWPKVKKTKKQKNKKTNDLEKFHPTDVMETGWDLLFFWVARMIMMSLFLVNEIPFKYVYLHGLVLDRFGQKMSKSKGNVIDPRDVIAKFGTDALRFSLVLGVSPGQDNRLYNEKVSGFRNFVNKLWNITRYILSQYPIFDFQFPIEQTTKHKLTLADRWILSKLNKLIITTTKNLENFNFNQAGLDLYNFIWHDFADWYIEISKWQIRKKQTIRILYHILYTIIRLLHPYAPFVTEEIFQKMIELSKTKNQNSKNKPLLMIEAWPKANKQLINLKAEKEFQILQEIIAKIRNFRSEYKIKPERIVKIQIKPKILAEKIKIIEKLSRTRMAVVPKNKTFAFKIRKFKVIIPIVGLFDVKEKRKKIEQEIKKIESYCTLLSQKLANKNFRKLAPKEIVTQEKEKFQNQKEKLRDLKNKLKLLSKL